MAVAVVVAALALGLVAVGVAYDRDAPRSWVPDLTVGLVLVAAGAVAWTRRTAPSAVAGLTALAGLTWWCGNFAGVDAGWVSWWGAQLTFLHRAVLVHAVLVALGVIRRWDGRALLVAGYVAATPDLATRPVVSATLGAAVAVVGLAHSGPGAAAVTGAARGRVGALLLAATLLLPLARTATDGAIGVWLLLYQAGSVATGLALVQPWRRTAPSEITDLVVRLGDGVDDDRGGISAVLAGLLDDPGVRVVESATVEPGAAGAGYVATPVWIHGDRTSYLVHHARLAEEPELLASLVGAVGLLLEHERLQRDLAERVGEVERSRARLVRVADEEAAQVRLRIERGAAARLDAVVAALERATASSTGPVAPLLADAAARARLVRTDLADIEHALVPDLSTRPLVAALHDLARTSPLPVTVTASDGLAPPPDVAAVVWFVCAEGLTNAARHAEATRVAIAVAVEAGRLVVTVEDDGRGTETSGVGTGLRNLTDRVDALGGLLRVGPGSRGGTLLTAELPLGGQG